MSVEPGFVEAEIGQSLEVSCNADGNPRPTIVWSKRQQIISTSDGILKFSSVTQADQGEYICQATNPSGTSTKRVTIYVQQGLFRFPFDQFIETVWVSFDRASANVHVILVEYEF